jgi:hypothetical protein
VRALGDLSLERRDHTCTHALDDVKGVDIRWSRR